MSGIHLSSIIEILKGLFKLDNSLLVFTIGESSYENYEVIWSKEFKIKVFNQDFSFPIAKEIDLKFDSELILAINDHQLLSFKRPGEMRITDLVSKEEKVFPIWEPLWAISIGNSKVIINAAFGILSLWDFSGKGKEIGSFKADKSDTCDINSLVYDERTKSLIVMNYCGRITSYDMSSFEKGEAVIKFVKNYPNSHGMKGLHPLIGTQKFLINYNKRKLKVMSITSNEFKEDYNIVLGSDEEFTFVTTLSNQRVLTFVFFGNPYLTTNYYLLRIYDVKASPFVIYENKEFGDIHEKAIEIPNKNQVLLSGWNGRKFVLLDLNSKTQQNYDFSLKPKEYLAGISSFNEYSSEDRKIFRCILLLRLKFLPKDLINEVFNFF
jgi:hypothetical protein